jgi:hypothetical protein
MVFTSEEEFRRLNLCSWCACGMFFVDECIETYVRKPDFAQKRAKISTFSWKYLENP